MRERREVKKLGERVDVNRVGRERVIERERERERERESGGE